MCRVVRSHVCESGLWTDFILFVLVVARHQQIFLFPFLSSTCDGCARFVDIRMVLLGSIGMLKCFSASNLSVPFTAEPARPCSAELDMAIYNLNDHTTFQWARYSGESRVNLPSMWLVMLSSQPNVLLSSGWRVADSSFISRCADKRGRDSSVLLILFPGRLYNSQATSRSSSRRYSASLCLLDR